MSYTSYSRLRAGIESPTHSISQPVTPTAIDLRGVSHRRARSAGQQATIGSAQNRPLMGLGEMTDAVIQQAMNGKQPKQQKDPADAERARQQLQQATLDAFTDQAEATASQPTARHAYVIPHSGEVVTSTPNTRNAPQWDGPLGSTGEPAGGFLGSTPSTFDSMAGYL